ncbi:MAG: 23S rRNA (pseudouridine(1915)-N(3))-methyltransferase RlmH [Burkholderiales bacterium]|nr:23S rRNA (pseudouridine(1915)-N(3))-methyltransferase RlmH [Burkholderiales bacterium]
MKFTIVAVARGAPDWVVAGYDEYARRMPPEARMELVEVKPEARASGKNPDQCMAAEARRIAQALPSGARVVVLDEAGRDLDTRALAGRVKAWWQDGRDVVFVIGGPDGLDADVKERADEKLRLSSLTLPHALVRVVLAEALYRAVSLAKGHPYHRE